MVIESMNIVVYVVEFVRYLIPSMTVDGILTSVDCVNDVFDLVRKWESFWTIYFPMLWKFLLLQTSVHLRPLVGTRPRVAVLRKICVFLSTFSRATEMQQKANAMGSCFHRHSVFVLFHSVRARTFWDGDTPTTFSSLYGGDKGFVRIKRV